MRERDLDVRVVFSDCDRVIIRDWYDDRRRSLPPDQAVPSMLPAGQAVLSALPAGQAMRGEPPPGNAKRLKRGDILPPGQAYRFLPIELELRLTRLPDGYMRVIVDVDIVIIKIRTRVVLDILYNANRSGPVGRPER